MSRGSEIQTQSCGEDCTGSVRVCSWISAGCSGDRVKLQDSVGMFLEREAVPALPALGISKNSYDGTAAVH